MLVVNNLAIGDYYRYHDRLLKIIGFRDNAQIIYFTYYNKSSDIWETYEYPANIVREFQYLPGYNPLLWKYLDES